MDAKVNLPSLAALSAQAETLRDLFAPEASDAERLAVVALVAAGGKAGVAARHLFPNVSSVEAELRFAALRTSPHVEQILTRYYAARRMDAAEAIAALSEIARDPLANPSLRISSASAILKAQADGVGGLFGADGMTSGDPEAAIEAVTARYRTPAPPPAANDATVQ